MGSQTILDLIASTIVFGSLLIISLRTNSFTSENMQKIRGDVIVQQNLVTIATLLEYDFRKIGYYANPDDFDPLYGAIKEADSNHIIYYTDLPPLGSKDSIEYRISSALADWTPNPRDKYLLRLVNEEIRTVDADIEESQLVYLGVTQFRLQYYDSEDNNITPGVGSPPNEAFQGNSVFDDPPTTLISTLQIDLECQSWMATSIDTSVFGMSARRDTLSQYQTAYWRQIRLAAKNLKNR